MIIYKATQWLYLSIHVVTVSAVVRYQIIYWSGLIEISNILSNIHKVRNRLTSTSSDSSVHKGKPIWLLKYNFQSILNILTTMNIFGPLVNLWKYITNGKDTWDMLIQRWPTFILRIGKLMHISDFWTKNYLIMFLIVTKKSDWFCKSW